MIKTFIKDGRTYAPISELKLWEKNPRAIKKDDFERLKRQIQKLGIYKPSICTEDGIVLGGNMRLRAYQELGIKEIWVSVVKAETETKMLEFALSDNDRVGYYEEQTLAELLQNIPDFDLEDFKVDLGDPWINLKQVIERSGPNIDPNSEWGGMPEFSQKDLTAFKSLIVNFTNIDDLYSFAKLIGQKITEKTRSIWHPEQKRESQPTYKG